jgi:hypothetical protein
MSLRVDLCVLVDTSEQPHLPSLFGQLFVLLWFVGWKLVIMCTRVSLLILWTRASFHGFDHVHFNLRDTLVTKRASLTVCVVPLRPPGGVTLYLVVRIVIRYCHMYPRRCLSP